MQEATQKAVTMDVGGTANKLLSMADRHASLIGAGALLLERSSGLQDSIARLLGGNIHGPEIQKFLGDISRNPKYPMAVFAIIGGELVKGSGIGVVNKLGSIVEKAAIAYLVAGLAENLLYYSTHSPDRNAPSYGSGGYGY